MAEKRIAYLLTDNGIDGREAESIRQAYWTAAERDAAKEASPNKAWLTAKEIIVDEAEARKAALAKLNGLDKLLLGVDGFGEVFIIIGRNDNSDSVLGIRLGEVEAREVAREPQVKYRSVRVEKWTSQGKEMLVEFV